MAHAYARAAQALEIMPNLTILEALKHRGNRLNIEADALQATLDALLVEPLGDYPLNGEPRDIDSQSNWKGEA